MSTILDRLAELMEARKLANGGDPATSYVSKLFAKGDDAILKKIGEEATETVMAAKDARVSGEPDKVLYEVADLWFHTLVLLKVEQAGGIACHTGRHSCFFQKFEGSAAEGEWVAVDPVLKNPDSIYK